eukprot:TRINITY_DN1471_c0_g1_i1.p1 TRINITY_DN1471_c0_g1~~TRINITY_DN1471_c0_g1_i1.p1  ORF type:complete len:932 (-),score=315.34 TRINITY_DN1471_c0_g1_i1:46-2841(-)
MNQPNERVEAELLAESEAQTQAESDSKGGTALMEIQEDGTIQFEDDEYEKETPVPKAAEINSQPEQLNDGEIACIESEIVDIRTDYNDPLDAFLPSHNETQYVQSKREYDPLDEFMPEPSDIPFKSNIDNKVDIISQLEAEMKTEATSKVEERPDSLVHSEEDVEAYSISEDHQESQMDQNFKRIGDISEEQVDTPEVDNSSQVLSDDDVEVDTPEGYTGNETEIREQFEEPEGENNEIGEVEQGFYFTDVQAFELTNIMKDFLVSQLKILIRAMSALKIPFRARRPMECAQSLLQLNNQEWLEDTPKTIQELWNDQGIKDTFDLRGKRFKFDNETATEYAIFNIDRFTSDSYYPTEEDMNILCPNLKQLHPEPQLVAEIHAANEQVNEPELENEVPVEEHPNEVPVEEHPNEEPVEQPNEELLEENGGLARNQPEVEQENGTSLVKPEQTEAKQIDHPKVNYDSEANNTDDTNYLDGGEYELDGETYYDLEQLTEEDKIYVKDFIYETVIATLKVLIRAAASLKQPIGTRKAMQCAQFIFMLPDINNVWTPDIAEKISIVWEDSGMQETYVRRGEFYSEEDADALEYICNNLNVILEPDYFPTDMDIMKAYEWGAFDHYEEERAYTEDQRESSKLQLRILAVKEIKNLVIQSARMKQAFGTHEALSCGKKLITMKEEENMEWSDDLQRICEVILNDSGINKVKELQEDNYILDNIDRIIEVPYSPTDQDIFSCNIFGDNCETQCETDDKIETGTPTEADTEIPNETSEPEPVQNEAEPEAGEVSPNVDETTEPVPEPVAETVPEIIILVTIPSQDISKTIKVRLNQTPIDIVEYVRSRRGVNIDPSTNYSLWSIVGESDPRLMDNFQPISNYNVKNNNKIIMHPQGQTPQVEEAKSFHELSKDLVNKKKKGSRKTFSFGKSKKNSKKKNK